MGTMRLPVVCILAAALVLTVGTQDWLYGTLEQSKTLAERISETFRHYTKYRILNEEYSKPDFTYKKWDFIKLVVDLAGDIEVKLSKAKKCLIDLRTRAQQLYTDVLPDDYFYSTQRKGEMLYSDAHQQKVSIEDSSYTVPSDVYINETQVKKDILWSENLLNVFKGNFKEEEKLLIWQYFCSENGVLRLYPATDAKTDAASGYDCRFQPWYIEGDGCARDIIIAFDLSGSMIGWPLKMAQETASQILNFMSDNDFLGYIGLSGIPHYLTDDDMSNITMLNRATDKMKFVINRKIRETVPDDYANFDAGINAAFDMFENSAKLNRSSNCQKILVIFSDGTIQNCKETFQNRNPDKDVQVFAFATGKPRTTTSGLQQMACANRGNFLKVGDLNEVNIKAFQFFKLINRNSENGRNLFDPKWSNAYMEEPWHAHVLSRSNAGKRKQPKDPKQMILTVSAPTYYQDNKTGIVGIDIRIKSLVTKVENLSKIGVYAVILNNRGNVIYHPRLKNLPNLDATYTARFAEVEQCLGDLTAADIEKEIISGREGMIEGQCFYYYSSQLERGREFFISLQYYYTPVKGYPFFLSLVVPKSFAHEMESLKNLTNVKSVVKDILEPPSEDSPPEVLAGKSIVGWFQKVDGTTSDMIRYDNYVINETAAHYSVVKDIIAQAWQEPMTSDMLIPLIIYTNAGLLLYSYRGWLDENSPNFTDNDRLLTALEAEQTAQITVGPTKPSTGYDLSESMFVTRNILVDKNNLTITPAIVGAEIYVDTMRQLVEFSRPKQGYKNVQNMRSMLVDNKGFIVYVDPDQDDRKQLKNKHLSDVYPQLMNAMVNLAEPMDVNDTASSCNPLFYNYTYINCVATCKKKIPKASSSTRISSFMGNALLFVYNAITFTKAHTQLGSEFKRTESFYRCCKTYKLYKLNTNNTACRMFDIQGCAQNTCTKRFYTAPVPGTNLLLLNDMVPDCYCKSIAENLRNFIKTDVFNMTFGDSSYSALPCTNNVNVSTVCNGARCTGPLLILIVSILIFRQLL